MSNFVFASVESLLTVRIKISIYHVAPIKLPEQKLNTNLGVEDIKEMTVVSPLEHRLRDLRAGETYRVCLYNEYYLGMDYEQNFCKEFELISNEADSNIAEVYEEVVIPAQNDDLETIIGLLTGALIVILSLIIVAVLFWRSNRYSNDKNQTLPPAGKVQTISVLGLRPETTEILLKLNHLVNPL